MDARTPAAVLACLALTCGTPTRAQQPDAALLTKATREALDDTFKDWAVAAVDPQAAACRRDGGAAPALVRGDVNSDGQPDSVLALKAVDGVHLVVVFERVADSVVVDVDRIGESSATGYLGLEPRGASFVNPSDGLRDYFSAETVALYRCGQPRTVYFWSGLAFRKVQLPEE